MRRAVLVVVAVAALGGGLRLWGLSSPHEKIFDETYYASDGCWYAGIDYRTCELDSDVERSWVHPPLGKQLIAIGVAAAGNRPFGWRIASVMAGTLTVAIAGALAFLLTGSAAWAGIGALLLATEHLHFVQSRIAMLDVFLTLFVALGFLLLTWDRVRGDRRRTWRPLRILAGASFGAAVAVKWSGVLALAGAALLAFGWEWRRRRTEPRALLRTLREESGGLLLAFALAPVLVYAATWLPWLAERHFDLGEWWGHHRDMAGYHLELNAMDAKGEPVHPYIKPAWSWLLLLRPVAYYWKGTPATGAEVLGIGNPLLFWGSLVVLPWLGYAWARRRDWRAGVVLVPVLVQLVPWMFVGRPMFLFYATPLTPFLALGAMLALRDLASVRAGKDRTLLPVALALVLASVALFAFFWPVLTGTEITLDAWHARVWFDGIPEPWNWV